MFTGAKYNLNTIPTGKWQVSGWIELDDEDGDPNDGSNIYNIPDVSDRLYSYRVKGDRQSLSNTTLITLEGLIESKYVPMNAMLVYAPSSESYGSTYFQRSSGVFSKVAQAAVIYDFYNPSSFSPLIRAGAALASGAATSAPQYRNATRFKLNIHSLAPVNDVTFEVRVKQWVQIPDINRSPLFRWYHGIKLP